MTSSQPQPSLWLPPSRCPRRFPPLTPIARMPVATMSSVMSMRSETMRPLLLSRSRPLHPPPLPFPPLDAANEENAAKSTLVGAHALCSGGLWLPFCALRLLSLSALMCACVRVVVRAGNVPTSMSEDDLRDLFAPVLNAGAVVDSIHFKAGPVGRFGFVVRREKSGNKRGTFES